MERRLGRRSECSAETTCSGLAIRSEVHRFRFGLFGPSLRTSTLKNPTNTNSEEPIHSSPRDYVGITDSCIDSSTVISELVPKNIATMGKKPSRCKLPAWAKPRNSKLPARAKPTNCLMGTNFTQPTWAMSCIDLQPRSGLTAMLCR